jgi:hypothetical protein
LKSSIPIPKASKSKEENPAFDLDQNSKIQISLILLLTMQQQDVAVLPSLLKTLKGLLSGENKDENL